MPVRPSTIAAQHSWAVCPTDDMQPMPVITTLCIGRVPLSLRHLLLLQQQPLDHHDDVADGVEAVNGFIVRNTDLKPILDLEDYLYRIQRLDLELLHGRGGTDPGRIHPHLLCDDRDDDLANGHFFVPSEFVLHLPGRHRRRCHFRQPAWPQSRPREACSVSRGPWPTAASHGCAALSSALACWNLITFLRFCMALHPRHHACPDAWSRRRSHRNPSKNPTICANRMTRTPAC